MKTPYRALVTALAAAATFCGQLPAYADPPSWAPAYGERDHDGDRQDGRHDDRRDDRDGDHRDDRRDRDDGRHDHDDVHYVRYGQEYWHDGHRGYYGYHGDGWANDYGVVSAGQCNAGNTNKVLLGMTGAVTGAVIGNRTASPDNAGIATVFGAIAGGIIGSAVGGAIDDADRACIGHSLELAPVGHPVYWRNPRSQVYWRVVPLRDVSPTCREFHVYRDYAGHHGAERVVACRRSRGAWDIRS